MIKIIWRKVDYDQLSPYLEEHHQIHLSQTTQEFDDDFVQVSIEEKDFERIQPLIKSITADVYRMFFETKQGWVQQSIDQVTYIEAFGDDIYMHLENQKTQLLSTPLYQLEAQLKPFQFVRISKSYIVNVRYILYIRTTLYGKLDLELTSGLHLDVTRSFVKSFKDALGIFNKEGKK